MSHYVFSIFTLFSIAQIDIILGIRTDFAVSENAVAGKVVVNLAQQFSISSRDQTLAISNSRTSKGAKYFTINRATGELIVKSPPDRDKLCGDRDKCTVELMIEHGDHKNPDLSTFHIQIIDVNDNKPVFPTSSVELKIQEERNARDVQKALPAAYDVDQVSKHIKYELDGPPEEIQPFTVIVKDDSPLLTLHRKLDRETKDSYKFRVLAKDGGQPEQTGTLSVHIIVEDTNDHKPMFERQSYSTIIDENTVEGTTILSLKATDGDKGSNGRIAYRMADPRNREERAAVNYFEIENIDGEAKVVIKKAVDIDKKADLLYKFTVIAFDQGVNHLESEVKVTIRVRDVNDDKPKININYRDQDGALSNRGLMLENEDKLYVAYITVVDRDSGAGGIVSCRVDSEYFYLQEIEGNRNRALSSENKWQEKKFKLLTRRGIDREKKSEVSFLIICHDNAVSMDATKKLTSQKRIQLRIIDKNDEAPQFSKEQYTFYLQENIDRFVNAQVGQVIAKDKDEGENAKISYSIVDDMNNAFDINRQTGLIYAKSRFDREITKEVFFKVKAVDNGRPPLSATAEVKVVIADVNDNPPVFKSPDYHFTVVENSRALKVGQVQAEDEDRGDNAQIEYQIENPGSDIRSKFSINRQTGTIHLNKALDREKKDQYIFEVIAIDNPSHRKSRNTGTTTVTISVLDVNDNPPQITSPANNAVQVLDDTDPIGKDLFIMKAVDLDEGVNGTVHYGIVRGAKGYFSIDRTAGVFYVMRKLEGLHNKLFSVTLFARDNGRVVQLNSTVTVRIRIQSGDQGPLPPVDHDSLDSGDTGRTLIVVAAIVLLLLVFAAVALLIMLRMRRVPRARRSPDEMKRKWKDGGFVGNVTETYVCSRTTNKPNSPKSAGAVLADEKVDEYLLESPTLRSKDANINYNSLNFYKGDPSSDKNKTYHTYYEVAKPTDDAHRAMDNYVPIDHDDLSHDGLTAQKSPFLGDMRLPGLCDSEMTMVGTMRRPDKPLTPYIEASFV